MTLSLWCLAGRLDIAVIKSAMARLVESEGIVCAGAGGRDCDFVCLGWRWEDLRRLGACGRQQAVDSVNVRDEGRVNDGKVGGIRGDGVGGRQRP